jgi:asparagine synthase (glutamine-hydrolysing)
VAGGVRGWVKRRIESLDSTSKIRRKLTRTFLCIDPEIEDMYFDNFSVFSRAMQLRLFAAEARERIGVGDPYRTTIAHLNSSDAEELLDQMLAADLKTYLHELLMKQDQMSMAASIESRVPFLDHKLVEFAAALPVGMKLKRFETKYILRRAIRDRLPKEILTRKKMGFPVPVGRWLRGEFRWVVEEYVLGERALSRGVFDRAYVRELVEGHDRGEEQSERLWALVNFEIWQRQFIDGEAITSIGIREEGCRRTLATAGH